MKRAAPALLLWCLMLVGLPARADGPAPLYPSPTDRLGFGVISRITDFPVARLRAGWYVNWGAAAETVHPAGLQYAQVLRTDPARRPDPAWLAQAAQANPGALWLVGNEPDCCYGGQDCMLPEDYAQVYHNLYTTLKAADPTAQVAIGGIVQATPLRLQWLDRVWQAYLTRYGTPMPVDVWNVHNFILQEKAGSWGCGIPPGIPATEGMLYGLNDHDRLDYFAEQIVRFRTWMRDHGQQDKPLIVSEYGILFPEELGYPYPRVRDFMLATFNYFFSATDPTLGCPADGGRLVQQWAWYSLDDRSFEWGTTWSALADPATKDLLPLGEEFAAYASARWVDYVDLVPTGLDLSPTGPWFYGEMATVVLTATVENRGNVPLEQTFRVRWYDGAPDQGAPSIGVAPVAGIPVRYGGARQATAAWSVRVQGPREVFCRVDPADAIAESDEANNTLSRRIEVNLVLEGVDALPPRPVAGPGGTAVVTLQATVRNASDVGVREAQVCFWDLGPPEMPIGCVGVGPLLPGESGLAQIPWAGLVPGPHRAWTVLDPEDAFAESDEGDNGAEVGVWVWRDQAFLPLMCAGGDL
ncbi:MAG: hypothetical protein H5T59_01750 [Anaerolineae bacterium]|nr:hypothetical protein [Anaerolineae bacterium]